MKKNKLLWVLWVFMKKRLILLFAALTSLLLALGICACAPRGGATHTHEWSDWYVVEEAGCEKVGTERRDCLAEGFEHSEDRGISALGHKEYTTAEPREADCETPGWTKGTACSVCHEVLEASVEIPALGHKYGKPTYNAETHSHTAICERDSNHVLTELCDFDEDVHAATCTAGGYTIFTCKNCAGSYRGAETSPLEHNYEGATWEPTENSAETHTHVRLCNTCGTPDVKDCSFQSTPHDATCEDDAYTEHVCTVCGDRHTHVQEGSALGHAYTIVKPDDKDPENHTLVCGHDGTHTKTEPCSFSPVTTDATCTADAYTTYTCAVCKDFHVETEKDSKLGHDFGGYTYKGKVEGVDTHEHSCLRTGCDVTESAPCQLVPIEDVHPCTQPQGIDHVCKDCMHTEEGEDLPLQHVWEETYTHSEENDVHQHTRKCTKCPEEDVAPCNFEHVTTDPTCLAKGFTKHTCSTCGFVYQDSETDELTHVWSGYTHSEENGVHKHTRTCLLDCGTEETDTCDFTETVVEPTCEDAGKILHLCKTCNHSYEEEGEEAKGHSYTVWKPNGEGKHSSVCGNDPSHVKIDDCEYEVETKPATCTEDGVITHSCDICHEVHTHKGGTAKGHVWGKPVFDGATQSHVSHCENGCGQTQSTACDFHESERKESTCSVPGWVRYTCDVCEGTYEVKMDRKPHEMGDWLIRNLGGDLWHHYRKCNNCSYNEGRTCVFSYLSQDVSCEEDGFEKMVCSICGNTVTISTTPATGHEYNAWHHDDAKNQEGKDTHTHECVHCGKTETEVCNFVPVAGTHACTPSEGVDTVCEQCYHTNDVPDLDPVHTWGTYTHKVVGGVHYHEHTCSVCSETESEPCELEVKTNVPDCFTPEEVTTSCPVCKFSDTVVHGEKLGHVWEEDSSNAAGHTHHCILCQTVETAEHDYEDSNICKYCNYDGLTYKLTSGGRSYEVVSASKVPHADRIVIAEFYGDEGLPVTAIGVHAFFDHDLKEVVIPASVLTIDHGAFRRCSNLETVTFDEGEEDAEDLSGLVSVTSMAFENCTKLTEIHLPAKVESIGDSAFDGCTLLATVTFPADHAVSMGENCFRGTALLDSTKWTGDTLYLCNHLLGVKSTVSGNFTIQVGTHGVAAGAFADCNLITGIDIPSSVRIFGKDAFKGCIGLENVEFEGKMADWFSIVFVSDLSSPMHYASGLHLADAVGDIVIPDGVTSIPAGTFKGTAITSVEIPEGVTSIGAHAFEDCLQLATIKLADSVRTIGEDAFTGSLFYTRESSWDKDGALYIGKHLIEFKQGTTFENNAYTVKEGTLTIGAYAFQGTGIVSVTLPVSLVYIEKEAFGNTSSGTLQYAEFAGGNSAYSGGSWFGQGIIGRQLSPQSMVRNQFASQLRFYCNCWRRLG